MKLFVTSLLAALLAVPAMSSFAAGEAAPAHGAASAPAAAAPAKVAKPDLVKGGASFAAVCVSLPRRRRKLGLARESQARAAAP
jgi:hypothetical protein